MPKKNAKEFFARLSSGRSRSDILDMISGARQKVQKDNTRINSGMTHKQSVEVEKEQKRMADVVNKEKYEAAVLGPKNFAASRKLAAMNKAGSVAEAYKYTDDAASRRTLSERLMGESPSYPRIEGAGVFELASPSPSKYGNIKFLRNIRGVPVVNRDGSVALAPKNRIFSNFTTDVPFRLHPNYPSMPGGEVMVVSPEAFSGKTPWSIHPMDTFFRSHDLTGVDPRYVTLLSGNEKFLNEANRIGMNTSTSQPLIDEYSKVSDWISKRSTMPSDWSKAGLIDTDITMGYRNLLDKELGKMGRPSKSDYSLLEVDTGLKSYTSSDVAGGLKELNAALDDIEPYYSKLKLSEWKRSKGEFMKYPDGDYTDYATLRHIEPYLRKQLPFHQNVFYNPIPTVESDLLQRIGGHGGQEYYDVYEEPLKWLFDNYVKSNPLRASGGKIHIKPENRGKFTALKKRTGHSASWFKAHGTPAQRKMATFAINARHWSHRHDLGGSLEDSILYDYLQDQGNPMSQTLLIQPQASVKPVAVQQPVLEQVSVPVVENPSEPEMPTTTVADMLRDYSGKQLALEYMKNRVNYMKDNYIKPVLAKAKAQPVPSEYAPSEDLIQYLMSTENFLERPDNSLDGHWTIGFGDTDKALNDYYLKHPNEKYTRSAAEKRLRERVADEFLGYAKKYTPNWDKLTPAQKDSLISYIYNIGPGTYKKHKNLFRHLENMDLEKAASEINAGWNQRDKKGRIMTGIRKRRRMEQQAFLNPNAKRFGVSYDDGGVLAKMDSVFNGDTSAMLDAVRKARENLS